jgi:oxygen-independent coproporphyrinogen III oxidase
MGNLGIYIQIPFCQTKCTYCNFHTGVVSAGKFAPYLAAVCQEIRTHLECGSLRGTKGSLAATFPHQPTPPNQNSIQTHTVDTVYIGGGTPSLLEPRLLSDMLKALRETFTCEFEEITLEADPETIDAEKAAQWAAAGINRISFGTQSFADEELKAAGRMHRRADIYRAVPILRGDGIGNISFDLIAGLPKQTSASWRTSLDESIALSPEHISIYMMEIDQGSRLGLEVLQGGTRYSAKDLPSEESMADFYETAQSILKTADYEQYEISNWAKPGYASKHNLKYWRREPYFGFGAGAHSFSGKRRWANVHDAAAYVEAVTNGRSTIESSDEVTSALALEEEFFLGLRQLAGVNLAQIEQQYGVDFQQKVGQLVSSGMIEREGQRVRLPASKLSVSNEIIVELLR